MPSECWLGQADTVKPLKLVFSQILGINWLGQDAEDPSNPVKEVGPRSEGREMPLNWL